VLTKRRKKFLVQLGQALGFAVFAGFFSGFSYLAMSGNLSKAVAMGLAMAISAPVMFAIAFLPRLLSIFHLLGAKPLPELAFDLGSFDPEVRQRAFRQLLQRKDAVSILLKVLDLPADKNEFGEWDGEEAHLLVVEGLGKLRAKEAVPKLIEKLQRTRFAEDEGENFLGFGRNW